MYPMDVVSVINHSFATVLRAYWCVNM